MMNEMVMFWMIALVMIVIALALLLPAFWGHYQYETTTSGEQNILVARERLTGLRQLHHNGTINDEQYKQQRFELENTLALDLASDSQLEIVRPGDKRMLHVLVLTFIVPVLAFSIYLSLGTPEKILLKNTSPSQSPHHSIDELLFALKQRLNNNPADVEGWSMLGRTYMTLDRFKEAANAYEKVIALRGDDAEILFAQADALAMANSGRLSGRPAELLKKGLKLKPNSVTGLWLTGLAEEEQGNDKLAIIYWSSAEKLLKDDPASADELRFLIRKAQQRVAIEPSVNIAKTISTGGIPITVVLAKNLQQKTRPTDTVFIYARAVHAGRMPLAIIKKTVSDLPVKVFLHDSDAVVPGMSISRFKQVNITVRVSQSGQAIPHSGDLLGEVEQVDTSLLDEVNVTINKQLP